MKKLMTLLALLLFFQTWTSAQIEEVTTKEPETSLAPTSDEKSLLWEISGKDLKEASYLYGTIHMIDKKDFFMTDMTVETFGKSEQVAFEIDMNKMNDFSVLFSLIGQVMMKDGVSLKDLLNEEDYKLVSDHFSEMGLPMFMFEKVKPMFLSSFAGGDMSGGEDMANGEIVS